jgi:1-acyl-sn-glycerol-3-phosphate acyltransferase
MKKRILKSSNHWITKIFSKLSLPIIVYGMENYPPLDKPILLALNHESKADSFVSLLALEKYFGRQLDIRAFVTAGHMDTIYGWWLRGQDMYRVEKGRGFEQLHEGMEFLRQGGHLAIFPEGHVRKGRTLPAKKGVSYIVHHTNVSVLPIHLEYLPSRYLWYRKCIMTIGPSMSYLISNVDEYQEFADLIMRRIDSLPSERESYTQIFHYA